MGRSWVTPAAANLASTMVLRPPASVLRDVAMAAPLAIAHAIEDVAGVRPDIKWPNDVQIGGRKVAGVLIETDLTDERTPIVLVGAGINVNFDPALHEEIRESATSVKAEVGHDVDREALLASYLLHFERIYEAAKAGEAVVGRWRERLVTLGHRVHASWAGGSADGVAEDVDDDGALLVRTEDGAVVRVEAGDVTLRE
jgi:BirA family biotin operon repressor/biotin-[acetyl-CoA-carboxylase] ligase